MNIENFKSGKYKNKIGEDGALSDELEYQSLDETDLLALTSLVSQSIGIDESRGDKISVKNLQFKRDNREPGSDGVSKAVAFSETYLAPFSGLFKYIFVVILLFILYKKVIIPFADRMLEVSKEDEELGKPILEIDDDEDEDLVQKVQDMRKKVEDQLGIGQGFNEDELKYEVILDKVKNMAEDNPEEVASLLQALLSEEAEGINPSKSG